MFAVLEARAADRAELLQSPLYSVQAEAAYNAHHVASHALLAWHEFYATLNWQSTLEPDEFLGWEVDRMEAGRFWHIDAQQPALI